MVPNWENLVSHPLVVLSLDNRLCLFSLSSPPDELALCKTESNDSVEWGALNYLSTLNTLGVEITYFNSKFSLQIQSDEKRESENLSRAVTKPLSVTQIEERAIEELKQFYSVDRIFDENIRVCRIDEDRILATPIWKKNVSAKR